tara:strand:- start:256 stop:1047 length:792 start_codon:yes stop_codon:yes gene_type:complete
MSIPNYIKEGEKPEYNDVFISLNNGTQIPVLSTDNDIILQLPIIIQAPKFKTWVTNLDVNLLDIESIKINNVKWFCRTQDISPSKLGFLYLELIAKDKRTNTPIPGIVFLRGNSVAVLILVKIDNIDYVITTKQMRVPIGKLMEEIPAGMMDADSNFSGVAMKEISEETGLKPPSENDLHFLGEISPSPGGCDEKISLYFWKTTISEEKKVELISKIHGEADENESILLQFILLDEFQKYIFEKGDVKGICAFSMAKSKEYIR